MEHRLSQPAARWITLLLRGLVAMAAGIAALTSPYAGRTLLIVYLAVDGILALILAARMGPARRRARLLVGADGVADLALALVLGVWVPNPGMLVLVVAIWAIATGVLELAAAVFLPRVPALAWGIAIVGLASCCIGVVAFDWTNLAEIGLLYLFGSYAVLAGVLFLTVGVLLGRVFRRGA